MSNAIVFQKNKTNPLPEQDSKYDSIFDSANLRASEFNDENEV